MSEADAEVARILVALDLRYRGRYYFGTLLGLTDERGKVRLERGALETAFREGQRLFPMDYRVPLIECDAEAQILVEGGPEFVARRAEAIDSAFLAPWAANLWQAARNEHIESSTAALRLDQPDSKGVVSARVIARPAGKGAIG